MICFIFAFHPFVYIVAIALFKNKLIYLISLEVAAYHESVTNLASKV